MGSNPVQVTNTAYLPWPARPGLFIILRQGTPAYPRAMSSGNAPRPNANSAARTTWAKKDERRLRKKRRRNRTECPEWNI